MPDAVRLVDEAGGGAPPKQEPTPAQIVREGAKLLRARDAAKARLDNVERELDALRSTYGRLTSTFGLSRAGFYGIVAGRIPTQRAN